MSHIGSGCKGCQDRVVGCHVTCEKYKAFKEEHARRAQEKWKQITEEESYRSYRIKALSKTRKR